MTIKKGATSIKNGAMTITKAEAFRRVMSDFKMDSTVVDFLMEQWDGLPERTWSTLSTPQRQAWVEMMKQECKRVHAGAGAAHAPSTHKDKTIREGSSATSKFQAKSGGGNQHDGISRGSSSNGHLPSRRLFALSTLQADRSPTRRSFALSTTEADRSPS